MARYPGATWRPLDRNYTRTVRQKRRLILHTSASGTATSLHGWFTNPSAGSSSHFHVAFDGTVEQYVDTDFMAWTSGEGNYDSIGIETQGTGNEPWTPAQLRSLAALIRWAHETHGIPLTLLDSSRAGLAGIGWHRLGVDGYFPALPSPMAGRTQRGGGERWSSARGKSCPGDDRILQIPELVKAAAGTTTSTGARRYKITGAASLNVRLGPGIRHTRLGSAPRGTIITATGRTSGGWIEGATPYMASKGQNGWWSGAELTEVK